MMKGKWKRWQARRVIRDGGSVGNSDGNNGRSPGMVSHRDPEWK